MRYEALFIENEKNKWLELEVTLGTNEALIAQDLAKLHRFLKSFDDIEKERLKTVTGLTLNLDLPLQLDDNPRLLKLLLVKKFIEQHGLAVIREAKSAPGMRESLIFLDIVDALFNRNEYPEKIYVYSVYRQRGTPNTWLKVISDLTPEEVEQKLESKIKNLQSYINYHLNVSRRFRFKDTIDNLTIFVFSKPIPAKVIKGELRNSEVQRATYTMVVFNKTENKLGVVTGSKREIQLIQRYLRYKLLPESIGTPRAEVDTDKKEMLKKLLASNPEKQISLSSVSLKTTQLPDQPSIRIKAKEDSSIDEALSNLNYIWEDLGVDSLKSFDYQFQGRNINVYLYGDEWKRVYINISAKRKSNLLENHILSDLTERLGANVKETRFVIESLSNEFILEKLFTDKKVSTFPPVPKEVERLIVTLVKQGLIKKPTKSSKRKCTTCYSFSWNNWSCPQCDREEMVVVGEYVSVSPIEGNIIRKLSESFKTHLQDSQTTLIPYKQRRGYKKSVIRIYNPSKNLSVFVLMISSKKDLPFVEDLLNEGFGVVAIVDPQMSEKTDHLVAIGCSLIDLHSAVSGIINNTTPTDFLELIDYQHRKVIERIFTNLRTSIDRLKNQPSGYNEDLFEVDITNLFQAIVPDVIRLGTEYKGQKVPDGYCCYGFRNSTTRKKRRLFGWDAKYSFSSSYRLGAADLRKQKGYLNWLTSSSNEPSKMGNLGIYAFISNFDSPRGFNTVLRDLSSWTDFPSQCRLVLIEYRLLISICEWLLDHWQQILENNSLSAEEIFKFIRAKRARPFNILTQSSWDALKRKLERTISS